MYVCMYVSMYVCMYVCMYVRMYVCMYVFSLSLYIYIYIYTESLASAFGGRRAAPPDLRAPFFAAPSVLRAFHVLRY